MIPFQVTCNGGCVLPYLYESAWCLCLCLWHCVCNHVTADTATFLTCLCSDTPCSVPSMLVCRGVAFRCLCFGGERERESFALAETCICATKTRQDQAQNTKTHLPSLSSSEHSPVDLFTETVDASPSARAPGVERAGSESQLGRRETTIREIGLAMGIPLYRERHCYSAAAQSKLPSSCPYMGPVQVAPLQVGPAHSHTSGRHHHHHVQAPQQPEQTQELPAHQQQRQPPTEQSGASELAVAAAGRIWRSTSRQASHSRDRAGERPVESHERSTARFTSRIVRSTPGSREHDDELRAAELVDLYFQELSRIRSTPNPQRQEATQGESPSVAAEPGRPSTERVLDQFMRRQRPSSNFSDGPSVLTSQMSQHAHDDAHRQAMRRETQRQYRSMHDTLVREQQRTQRSPRAVQEQTQAFWSPAEQEMEE